MLIGSKLRAGVLALTLAAAGGPLLAANPAAAESGADLVEACEPATEVPEAGPRACGSVERLLWLASGHCRRVPGADEMACPGIDGRPINETAVAEFEQGWTAQALELQRELDQDVSLTAATFLHTHNSANSTAYAPSFTTNDANQVLTITDQLRLGIRGIEIDVHWAENPAGSPAHGFREPVQCHGEPVATPFGVVHGGCSVDQPLVDLLVELRAWLDRPENADELVILYLENALDDEQAAHDDAVASIEATIGDLVHRPTTGGGCQDLPVQRTERELLADGARVLMTGNCGPGAWTDWVFQRGSAWNESGGSTNYGAGVSCDEERRASNYDTTFIRRYEDSTFLSLTAGAGSYIAPDVAAEMARCGVNFPGLDQLHPGDERLPAFVWSWRRNEPSADPAAACAAQGPDARFGALPCATPLPVACRTDDGGWAVTADAVPWAHGDLACAAAGHAGAGVPANGWDNELLRRAAGDTEVWLAYRRDAGGDWKTGIPDLPDDPDTPPKGKGPDNGMPPKAQGPKDKGSTHPGAGGREHAATNTTDGARKATGTTSLPAAAAVLGATVLAGVVGPGRRRRAARR